MTLIAVVGPTAAGKSDLAVELARALGGEVINADSMQLYRGMDIGTAKLTQAERRGVPHHLLDVWDVTRTASVAEYQELADAAIADIESRGRVPVVAGGSGLYIRAALGDLEFPGTDEAIRARLESELAAAGPAPLYDRLRAADPAAAAAILPGNGRRIVRALEVIELSGRPFSATMPGYDAGRPAVQIGVQLDRAELDRRIADRVDRMWAAGLEAEVRELAARGLREGKTASRALGYQQLLRCLDGELTSDQARDETARATRRFARRQESWFRRDPRVRWLSAGGELPDRALSLIAAERVRNSALPRTPPSAAWPPRPEFPVTDCSCLTFGSRRAAMGGLVHPGYSASGLAVVVTGPPAGPMFPADGTPALVPNGRIGSLSESYAAKWSLCGFGPVTLSLRRAAQARPGERSPRTA